MSSRTAAGIILALGAVIAAPELSAQSTDLVGVASVTDGDSLVIHGQRIRLEGIDAPESRQVCSKEGQSWRCGQKASLALADHIGRQTVRCEHLGTDRYQRVLARCFLGDLNLNEWMVRQGWAVAYRQYSQDYVEAEDAARAQAAGIWSSDFQMPWDWRRAQRKKK